VGHAKVLVVDANQDSRAALAHALTEAGYEAAVATSGSFALTMLEWEQPDLIVSYAKVQDMDGYELFTMVRRDPATKDTPFLLLAGRDRPIALAATEAGVDMTVTGDFSLDTVMSRIKELLGDEPAMPAPTPRPEPQAGLSKAPVKMPSRTAEPVAPAPPPVTAEVTPTPPVVSPEPVPPVPPPAKPPAEVASRSSFQGSLGVMDLTELTQVISLGLKTGELHLSLSKGEGVILFEAGRVVHAEFAEKSGEPAFAAMVAASQREGEARFCFNRAEREAIASRPRTISRNVEQLLLSVAQEIDETSEHAGGGREAARA
jgi:CheY-like chemotaxis protein